MQQFSFEETVLKGLAADQGLFLPEDIPSLPPDWQDAWSHLTFSELAFRIFSLYISPSEIEPMALRDIIDRSYSTFRVPSVTPTVTLDSAKKIHLLELYHGETFAFKDIVRGLSCQNLLDSNIPCCRHYSFWGICAHEAVIHPLCGTPSPESF